MVTATAEPATSVALVPKWVRWAAHTVPLLVVPSGVWRVALAVGIPVGFTGELARLYHAPGWITPYLFGLTIAAEVAAMLTLGLVQTWGEIVPGWVPRIGGRRIPTLAAVVTAAVGVVGLMMIMVPSVGAWNGPDNMGDPDSPQGVAGWIMTASYAPMLAWPPLLAVVTVAYYVRRRRADRSAGGVRRRGGTAPA